jgi:hypothetical protein
MCGRSHLVPRDVAVESIELVEHAAVHLDVHGSATTHAELVQGRDTAAEILCRFFDGEEARAHAAQRHATPRRHT